MAHEYEENSLLYHFRKYNEKNSSEKKGYLAYKKLSCFNNRTRKIYDHLKDTYVINVVTDNSQYDKPPNTIVKRANSNRRPIQNCTSVYQMQLCTVNSALIIGRIPFALIKGSIYSDPIDYLLCNQ